MPIRAILLAASYPTQSRVAPDLFDLACNAIHWAAARSAVAAWIVRQGGRVSALSGIEELFTGVNPRRHPWNLVTVVALAAGAVVAFTQMFVELGPGDSGRLLLVVALFIGLEAFAVALGYALLGDILVLLRHEPTPP